MKVRAVRVELLDGSVSALWDLHVREADGALTGSYAELSPVAQDCRVAPILDDRGQYVASRVLEGALAGGEILRIWMTYQPPAVWLGPTMSPFRASKTGSWSSP